jgi:CheY-like chemotaxis protein
MPGMTGLDLIPRIKQNMPDLPIVMITAYADPVTEKRALERGAEHVFAKPIDFAALKADIDLRIAARERGV